MAAFRMTMFFSVRKSGWTESWYNPAGDHAGNMTALKQLAHARKEMLGIEGRLEFLRVSDVDNVRDALVATLLDLETQSEAAIAAQAHCDDPSEGLLARHNFDPTKWRSSFYRGTWDNNVRNGADPTLLYAPGFKATWDTYRDVLKGGQFYIRNKDQAAPKTRVLNLGPWGAVTSRTQIFTVLGHGLVRDDLVQILCRKPGTLRRYLGKWRVVDAPTPDSIVIEAAAPAVATVPNNMFVQKVVYTYSVVKDTQFERWGKKRCGRPFGVPVGRLGARLRV